MRAVIVASGPSALDFDPPDDVTIIAVNGAIRQLGGRPDYWFSLDASERNRQFLREALNHCVECHVAGFPWSEYIARLRLDYKVRVWKRIEGERDGERYLAPSQFKTPLWWHARLQAVSGICKTPGAIHTGNSAWGALGLAYHLGYRDVALVGVDATADERIDGGKPGNLSHLPMLFKSAIPDMRVVSCGLLDSIPQTSFGAWYENR